MKAVITGHTRGLGAAIAETLLARGVPVLGIARNMNGELGKRFAALEQLALDLSDSAALVHWLQGTQLRRFLAGSDTALLVNNAGVVHPLDPLARQDAETVARALSVNVTAPLALAAAFAAAAPAGAERRIVHVSSGAGRKAYPGWSIYCASKAALDNHARAVAQEHTPGLRICSLAPGVLDTEMQTEIRAVSPDRFPAVARFENLKREGSLIDPAAAAARLVAYLLSPAFGEEPVADLRALN